MVLSCRSPSPPLSTFLNRCLQECHTGMDGNGPRSRSSGAVHLQELTTRELKETVEVRYDTIAGVLNLMLEDGGLVRRRKGKRKVLWHLVGNGKQERTIDEDKPPENGSRFKNGSQKSKPPGIGSVDRKEKTCPVENKTVPVSPPRTRAREPIFGNQFVFRRQGSAETGKPKAPSGLSSKTQSQDRFPGRQPYGSVPLWEDLTEWRNAETVRLIDRKPEVPGCMRGSNGSSSTRDERHLDGTLFDPHHFRAVAA